jgi:hypothetical protein
MNVSLSASIEQLCDGFPLIPLGFVSASSISALVRGDSAARDL